MASILETFVYLFQSDASALDQGLQTSDQRADQTRQHLEQADNAADNLGSTFKDLALQAAGVFAAFMSVGSLIEGVKSATEFADKLGETAEALELNVEDLSAWSDAAQMSGGSADEFQSTLKSLNTAMTTADVTGKSKLLPFFKELGINMLDANGKARPVMSLLPEMAKSFEKLTKAQALAFGQKLGLDQGTVMMLQQGQREVEALVQRQRDLGVATAEDAEIAGNFNDALDDTAHAFRSVYMGIGSAILPYLTKFNVLLQDGAVWVRENKNVVTGFFIAVGAVIAYNYLPAAISAAASTLAMAAPFILTGLAIAAAAAAFALIYDDIMTFLDGGDSVTGQLIDWINSFALVKAAIEFVQVGFGFLSDQITGFINNSGMMQAAIAIMVSAFEGLRAILDSIIESFSWIIEKGAAIGSVISSVAGALGDKVTASLQAGTAAMQSASSAPLASQTSNSISSANNSRSVSLKMGDTNIHTQATDAEGISKGVSGHLKKQMRQTAANFDDGVAG